MKAKQKTVINVASDTGLSPSSIRKYLNNESVNTSTEKLLEHWVAEHSKSSGGHTAA